MTKLPRRRIEPLDPAPDSFDRVLTGARRRRRRTALVVASSSLAIAVVAAGSFALGSSLNQTHRLEQAAADKGANTPSAGPSSLPTASASRTHAKATHTRSSPTEPATAETISRLRGRAVDPSGRGLAGLYVLPGSPNHLTFSSDGKAGGRTDAQGYYDIPCPRAPVLLATWKLNSNVAAVSTGGTWASTFVEGSTTKPVVPSCGRTTHTTTMDIGASLRGTVHVTGDCAPGTTFPVWVWLNGDRGETVRLVGLRDGDTFTFAGLPAGTHKLGARGVTTLITVLGGDSQQQDAIFTCADGVTPGSPTDSSSPTVTPTPTPTPSETPTPTPTLITPSPTPSPTVS
jgi:hypothetical protein